MSDKEQQIKNSFLYLLPVLVGTIIPFLTLAVFARVLTKEDYGVLALVQIYGTFITGLANFGLLLIYERNFFEYRAQKEAAQLLYTTLFFVFTTLSICLCITYLFKDFLASWITGSPDNASLLFWTTLSIGVLSFKTYYLTYFKNTENAKPFVWYTIDESVLGAVISLFLVVYMRTGVIGLVWGQLAASLIIFTILGFRFLKILPLSFNLQILGHSLRLSYPLTTSLLFKVIGTQFDKYMISLLGTIGGVGVYSIGQKVSQAVFSFMTAIENVFSPQVYRRMFNLGNKGGESVGTYLTPFLYFSIVIALCISLFAEEIITVLTPPPFHDAIDIVIILSMLLGSHFFGKAPQLVYAKKTFIPPLLTLVRIVLNIAINIPFIVKWGAIGAAWGAFIAGIAANIVSFVASQHYYSIKWEYGKIVLIFLIFFGSAGTMILLRYFEIPYGVRLMVKFISLTGYLYLGMTFNVLTKQSYLLVKNMIFPDKIVSDLP
jgi:O-antigen/teichoic acid export membrane protein